MRGVVDTALLKCYVLTRNPGKLEAHVALPAPLCRCGVPEAVEFLLAHGKADEATALYRSHGQHQPDSQRPGHDVGEQAEPEDTEGVS